MARNFASASSQYISAGSAVVTAVPFTMACWMRPTNVSAAHVLMSIGISGGIGRWQITENQATGNPCQITSTNNAGTLSGSAISTGTVTAGVWHHFCGVFISDASRTAYLNGTNAVTDTTNVAPTGVNTTLIGARINTTVGAYANGDIAEVAIWNVALTTTEIAALGTMGSNGGVLRSNQVRPESLVFYDPMDDLWTYDRARGLFLTDNAGTSSALDPPQLNRGRIPTPILLSQRDPGNYRFFFSAA